MRYLRLLGLFLKVGIMGELAYRASFFVHLLGSAIELATAFAGLAVVFSHTATLGGWSADQLIGLVGVYFLVGGAIGFVIQPSMERLTESVREGTLDFTLTKPEDAQLLASMQGVEIWKLTDMLLGLAVIVAAFVRMKGGVTAAQAALFVAALAAGGVIVYSFWLLLASLSFWLVRIENILVIFQSVYEAGRWPVDIYPGWLRAILTFLVPVAFATTVPARVLAGRYSVVLLAGAPALAALLFAVSRLVWKAGIRHYSGASS